MKCDKDKFLSCFCIVILSLGLLLSSSAKATITEFRVNTNTTGWQPSAAINDSGNFVITWVDTSGQDGSYTGIYAQRYNNSGDPVGSEFQVNTHWTFGQEDPSAAMDASGNFVIAWHGYRWGGGGWSIYAQLYDSSGDPVGSEFQVNTHWIGSQGNPSAAMDDSGNFVIAWESQGQDGSGPGIYAQLYDSSGNPVGSEFQVNTHTTVLQWTPSAAMDASGNFVIAWEDLSWRGGDYWGIYAQRYDNSGNPVGSEFQVNTIRTGNQRSPSAAMDASGNFVISWQSFEQIANNRNVYAQRYDSSGSPLGSGFLELIRTLVNEGVIAPEIENSLIKKIENAEMSSTRDNICAVVNEFGALINQVNGQRGNKISDSTADFLISYINNVVNDLLNQLPAGESC